MRSRLIVFLPVLVLLGTVPSAASAASIAVDRACYADPGQRKDTVRLTGAGFTPSAQYQVTLDGQPLTGGTGTTDAAGNLSGSFTAPQLAAGVHEHAYTLGVQEGPNAPSARFTVSTLLADFTPPSGDPKTLRVRFSVFGFGLSGIAAPAVYVHYVRPDTGRVQQTIRLGTGTGACGSVRQTKKRRLFPFAARKGTWRLQFDSSRTYRKGTSKSPFLFFAVAVKVRGD
ncbi:MAG: hypothetical protein JWM31_1576 [Solirubrobacterales bacterium]|nr:hypothetical protein [Solirubrobacterales bacterium]